MTRREIYQMRRGLALETPTQQPQQSAPMPLKHVLAHHRTLEQHHRSLCSKMEKSPLRAGREMAVKHRRLWHHHAKIRTQLEERERQGQTSVAMSSMPGLTRRERYELRTNGLGLAGALRGAGRGLIGGAGAGAGAGASIGVLGGPGGIASGAGIGGALGGALGALGGALDGHKREEYARSKAKIDALTKSEHKPGADMKDPKQKAAWHREKSREHREASTAAKTDMDRDYHDELSKQHENTAREWDESKHPRAEDGEFT